MKILRAILIWIVALSLPIEGMAATAMSHCKQMQRPDTTASMQGMGHHDHAAMMASMSGDSSMEKMDHEMLDGADHSTVEASKSGCQCGCTCGGSCAMSCPGMMVSLTQPGLPFEGKTTSARSTLPRSEAHAAFRDDPLRPPSAVAL